MVRYCTYLFTEASAEHISNMTSNAVYRANICDPRRWCNIVFSNNIFAIIENISIQELRQTANGHNSLDLQYISSITQYVLTRRGHKSRSIYVTNIAGNLLTSPRSGQFFFIHLTDDNDMRWMRYAKKIECRQTYDKKSTRGGIRLK